MFPSRLSPGRNTVFVPFEQIVFFYSNALIALARSLRKCLLAVLITASEADAVADFLDSWVPFEQIVQSTWQGATR